MKNNIDYIYEYSDLNLFQNRAQILTGKYKDVILEFGASGIMKYVEDGYIMSRFDFDYDVYENPHNLDLNNREFELFCGELLTNIIKDREDDPDNYGKLMQAASEHGVQDSKIRISDKWYPNGRPIVMKQPIVIGAQEI